MLYLVEIPTPPMTSQTFFCSVDDLQKMARFKNRNYGLREESPSEMMEEEDPQTVEEDDNEEEAENSDGSEDSGGNTSHPLGDGSDSESSDEIEAMQPLQMYFPPSEYKKKIKISTRCYIAGALETLLSDLNPPLTKRERSWFETHPQFKHILHMPRDKNHKFQGMWMLLLRTACTEKEKEAWFVVNGVPIRYSIKEHALISGLDCHNYPVEFAGSGSQMGKMDFVDNYFKKGSKIRYQDVKAKLLEMGAARDRLNMAVLFFLSSIIKGLVKTGKEAPSVDPFLLRAVNDLELCRTFPWGRLSFDHTLEQIAHTMNHFGGFVKENVKNPVLWPISGFCIPLELLAFEAIAPLRMKFRVPVPGADEGCPRMCRSKFTSSEMKGFPFEQINAELGATKDIDSLLIPSGAEKALLREITEKKEDDKHCVVVQSWMDRIGQGVTVFFENMFKEYVDCRSGEGPATAAANDEPTVNAPVDPTVVDLLNRFKEEMDERMTKFEDMVGGLVEKVDELGKKVAPLEAYVNEQLSYMRTYEENVNGNREKEGESNVAEKDNVSKEGEQGGGSVEMEEEPVKENDNVSKEGEQGGGSVEMEEEPEKEKENVEEAPTVVPPIINKRTRIKQCSRKSAHSLEVRDAINKKLKEGRLKRQKLEEATEPTRMSTRLADKEKQGKLG